MTEFKSTDAVNGDIEIAIDVTDHGLYVRMEAEDGLGLSMYLNNKSAIELAKTILKEAWL